MKKNLLIGCGRDHGKKIHFEDAKDWDGKVIKIDMNPNCGADIVWDLEYHPLPFEDCSFNELHAYNCMEHWGNQGDWKAWFDEMAEYWRILKPGGLFCCLVPIGLDAYADPGHTRFFHPNHFYFLNQAFYDQNEVKGTCFTDYRWYWKLNFDLIHLENLEEHHLGVMLQKA